MTKSSRKQTREPFRSTATIARDLNLKPAEVRALGTRLGVKRCGTRLQWTPAA